MGEVYRAMDPRLHRQVAVKVLSPEMANDPTVRQRFEIEARAASNISHPNIVAVYDFGNQDGMLYIVWELVEGKSLAGQSFPVKKALDIGAQIAEGIAAAHAAHIVHRDLKPENVIVTNDGRAKILDFGLAKRTTRGLGEPHERTSSLSATQSQPGMLMGTIGYMSPEQVKGLEVDHRTDIFSFGLVLYEILTGRKPFAGDTAIAMLHGIVNAEPQPLPETIPMAVRQVVLHCLEKSPDQRFQSASDLSFALRALSGADTRTGIQTAAFERPQHGSRLAMILAAVLGIGAVGAFFAGRMLGGGGGTPSDFKQLTFRRGFVSGARFAPGGKAVAYSAAWSGEPMGVYSTSVESGEPQSTGVSRAHVFAVSKQGEMAIALNASVGPYQQFGKLARVPLTGGSPREVANNVAEADWDPSGGNLAIVVLSGAMSRLEYPPGKSLYETSGAIRSIRFSPQGDKIAFFDHPLAPEHGGNVAIIDLNGKKTALVSNRLALEGLAWSQDGKEIWFGSGPATEATQIEATDLEGKTRKVFATPGGLRVLDIAPDGSVLFARRDDHIEMIAVRGEDTMHPARLSWLNESTPRQISNDGSRVLFTEFSASAGHDHAVALRSLDGSALLRLGEGAAMALAPDGSQALALLHGTPPQFVLYPSSGSGASRKLPPSGVIFQTAAQFHPDGQSIIFEGGTGKVDRLWQQNLASGQSRAFSPEGVTMTGQSVSPNGEFVCAKGPDNKLALYPVAGGATRPVAGSNPGDRFIRWNGDGKLIYVYDPHSVPVHIESIEVATGKRGIFTEYVPLDPTGIHYVDAVLSADGKRAVYGLHRALSTLQVVKGLK
jgi:WD40 repeat protein